MMTTPANPFDVTDEQKTKAAAAQIEAMACDRFPPDILQWSVWLEPFFEPEFGPHLRAAAIRAYAKLYWQLEAHCSAFGPH